MIKNFSYVTGIQMKYNGEGLVYHCICELLDLSHHTQAVPLRGLLTRVFTMACNRSYPVPVSGGCIQSSIDVLHLRSQLA